MPSSSFGLECSASRGRRVLRARGRLVAGAGADSSAWDIAATFANVEQVVLDLAEVTAIDAGGLGRLLAMRQALVRRGARLVVASASPRVRRVLQLTALEAIVGMASGHHHGPRTAGVTPASPLCRCA